MATAGRWSVTDDFYRTYTQIYKLKSVVCLTKKYAELLFSAHFEKSCFSNKVAFKFGADACCDVKRAMTDRHLVSKSLHAVEPNLLRDSKRQYIVQYSLNRIGYLTYYKVWFGKIRFD